MPHKANLATNRSDHRCECEPAHSSIALDASPSCSIPQVDSTAAGMQPALYRADEQFIDGAGI